MDYIWRRASRILILALPVACGSDSSTSPGEDDTSSSTDPSTSTSTSDPSTVSSGSGASSDPDSSGSSESGPAVGCDYEVGWTASVDGALSDVDIASAVVIDGAGDVFVAGSTTTDTDRDMWVQKYAADGTPDWTFTWNSEGDGFDAAAAIALLSTGDLIVAGNTEEVGDAFDGVVMRLQADGTTVAWLDTLDGPLDAETGDVTDAVRGVAIGEGDRVIVVGQEPIAAGDRDGFVRRYSEAGDIAWTQHWDGGAGLRDQAEDLTIAASGEILVVGELEVAEDVREGHVRRYAANGDELDSALLGDWRAEAIALDSEGNLVFAGWRPGALTNIVVAKHDPDFTELWLVDVNGSAGANDFGEAVTVDADDHVVAAGHWGVTGEARNAWVGKFDPAGNALWSADYNNEEASFQDASADVAVGGDGQIVVAGSETVLGQEFNAWIRQYVPVQ